jgi:hypothetical protein
MSRDDVQSLLPDALLSLGHESFMICGLQEPAQARQTPTHGDPKPRIDQVPQC